MGSVCCVSARDAASERASGEILRRTMQYSPSWGVRWDNRGRVAGEDAPLVNVDRFRQNTRLENKSEPFFGPVREVSLSEANVESNSRKSATLNENVGAHSMARVSESPEARSISTEVEEITELPAARDQHQTLSSGSPDMRSVSYSSSLPPRIHLAPVSSSPSKWSPRVPRSHLLRQGSDSQLSLPKSPSNYSASEGRSSPSLPVSSTEPARGSHGGSLDGFSDQSFLESIASTHGKTWSFDSDSLGSHRHKLGQSGSRKSDSHSNDLKTCAVCSTYLVEKSAFSSQKIVPSNELSIVAILVCGHVYHADCLEHLTPEISKYDPPCPVCTFGEQQAVRMFEKVLKAEMDMKSNNKKHRNRIVNSDFVPLARGSSPRLAPSSSFGNSSARPFLKRHFPFGTKASSSLPENHPVRKRSLLWSKSSKFDCVKGLILETDKRAGRRIRLAPSPASK